MIIQLEINGEVIVEKEIESSRIKAYTEMLKKLYRIELSKSDWKIFILRPSKMNKLDYTLPAEASARLHRV